MFTHASRRCLRTQIRYRSTNSHFEWRPRPLQCVGVQSVHIIREAIGRLCKYVHIITPGNNVIFSSRQWSVFTDWYLAKSVFRSIIVDNSKRVLVNLIVVGIAQHEETAITGSNLSRGDKIYIKFVVFHDFKLAIERRTHPHHSGSFRSHLVCCALTNDKELITSRVIHQRSTCSRRNTSFRQTDRHIVRKGGRTGSKETSSVQQQQNVIRIRHRRGSRLSGRISGCGGGTFQCQLMFYLGAQRRSESRVGRDHHRARTVQGHGQRRRKSSPAQMAGGQGGRRRCLLLASKAEEGASRGRGKTGYRSS
mmetsp:Transcript_25319/g.63485  ORF Transcript_25319/g.63485 Transcript_25319/m.63485 type:complete len:308 (-) Transcript_25319:652-1575(-)